MALGNLSVQSGSATENLPLGTVRTSSGRISSAVPHEKLPQIAPFHDADLMKIDDALVWSTRAAKLRFSLYIGDLGQSPAEQAVVILSQCPEPEHAVLFAISPNTQDIYVLSGSSAAVKVTDQTASLGVTTFITQLKNGSFVDAVIASIRTVGQSAAKITL